MDAITKLLEDLSNRVWGPPMLALLVGTHVYLTFRLRFIQRYLGRGIRLSLQRDADGGEGDVSQFGALATALAATIGTGNIVGVGTAIASGGPGAVFWMWLTGVFGIATKYAEALLAVKYRISTPNGMAGGPMYVLERGMGNRPLAIAFAAFTAVTAFGIGNTVQANSVAVLARETFGVPAWLTGAVLTVLTALVILGGIRSIAAVSERLVPFMAIFNIVGCLVMLVMFYDTIPETLALIVSSAFTGQAAVGGFLGAGMREAMRYGVARGLFSNESGMGSAAIVAAAARTKDAVSQALVSSTGTFWDTVVMCALVGIVFVNSGEWTRGLSGSELSSAAFADLPVVGPIVLTVGLLTFVFATLIGWSYYGEKACEYLLGPSSIRPYRWLWVAAVMIGSILPLPVVWAAADISNALMAIPNLIALLVLTRVVVDETREHLWDEDAGARRKHGG